MTHTYIRLFREIYDVGGSYSLEERLRMTASYSYNKAIDDAISIAKVGLDHSELIDDRSSVALLNEIISRFEKLKKP